MDKVTDVLLQIDRDDNDVTEKHTEVNNQPNVDIQEV